MKNKQERDEKTADDKLFFFTNWSSYSLLKWTFFEAFCFTFLILVKAPLYCSLPTKSHLMGLNVPIPLSGGVGEELYTPMGFLFSQFWPIHIFIVENCMLYYERALQTYNSNFFSQFLFFEKSSRFILFVNSWYLTWFCVKFSACLMTWFCVNFWRFFPMFAQFW